MNADKLKGQISQLKGKIQEKWSILTDEDMANIEGSKDKLLGKLQEIYGYTKEEAQAEWEDFYRNASEDFNELSDRAASILSETKENVSEMVHNSPWKAMGVAAAIGLLIGLRF